jgi:hypothetical protein
MKYAINFSRSFSHFDEIDEVIFDYHGGEDLINSLPQFIKENQRAIIDISCLNETEIKEALSKIKDYKQTHLNTSVLIDFFTQSYLVEEELKEYNIPFFYSTYARSYSMARFMVAHGATDLYIVEDLAFDLKNLQCFREEGVQLRLFPDIAQHSPGCYGNFFPEITKFWIRPEDIDEYDKYIDVLEFTHKGEKLSTIYEIYKQKQWLGEIKDIVSDFHIYIDNTSLAPYFGPSRISCQKKCATNRCNICIGIQDLAEKFDKADIAIIKSKDNHLTEEEKEKLLKIITKGVLNEDSGNQETLLHTD